MPLFYLAPKRDTKVGVSENILIQQTLVQDHKFSFVESDVNVT